jgi:AraC-like DNA-binding protein
VARFWLRDARAQPYAQERMLPLGRPGMTIDLGGDELRIADPHDLDPRRMRRFSESVSYGAHARWYLAEAGQHVARIGVLFKPGGAYPFFGPSAGELHGLHVSLDALWGRRAAEELRERLNAARTPEACFHVVERVLLHRLTSNTRNAKPNVARHPAVAVALDALRESSRPRTIAQVVDQSGLSHRQFIAVFRREVGMSPKRFCRLRRFLDVAYRAWETNQVERVDWVALALAHGYYDQAHLAHDFREFAGVSPTAYLRARDPSSPFRLAFAPTESDILQSPA